MKPEQFTARVIQGLARANALHHPGRADTWLQDRVSADARKSIMAALFGSQAAAQAI